MRGERLRTTVWAVVALALGAGLRLWFISHAGAIGGDSLVYGDIAKNWITHGVYGFSIHNGVPIPTLIRLPGYPLFLTVCFRVFGIDNYTAVMLIQCVIDLGTCVLVSALAGRLFRQRAAMVALWLTVLCPFTANYVAAPLTETPTLATIALAFYSLERWRAAGPGWNCWLWILSADIAYSLLLRPEQCLLAAAIIPAMLWMALRSHARTIAPIAAAAVCVVLPLSPWTARNWHTFHVLQPLAPKSAADPGEFVPKGFYRWYRTWAIDFISTDDVYWNYNAGAVEIGDLPTRAFDTDDQYARTDALLSDYNETDDATSDFDARFAALARERIRANPLRYYVALPVARVLNMLLRPRTEILPIALEWWKWSKHPKESAFSVAYAAVNLVYLVLGGLGIWRWRQRNWDGNPGLAWAMLGYLLLRLALLLTIDNSEPRYTLEFFPLLAIWTGALFMGPHESRIRPDES